MMVHSTIEGREMTDGIKPAESVGANAAPISQRQKDKAQRKAEWREQRNREQAIEEKAAWSEIHAKAAIAYETVKRGRPSSYNQTIADDICTRLSNGESIMKIVLDEGYPSQATIYNWLREQPSFLESYSRARDNAAHTLFDECLVIADDTANDLLKSGEPNNAAITRAKLRIETRMRMAGKLAPKVYSDRVETLAASQVNVTMNTLTVDARELSSDQRSKLRELLLTAKLDK